MDARAAAHVLAEIATLRQLRGEDEGVELMEAASKQLGAQLTRPLGEALHEGHFPAVVADVLQELIEHGDSSLLDDLREETPEGLQEMLRVPGLGPSTIQRVHAGLGIETLQELEDAVRDGRLATLPRFGPRLVERVRNGIMQLRATGATVLLPHADAEAVRLLHEISQHDGVSRVATSGLLRRRMETVNELALVVECTMQPIAVAATLTHLRGVQRVVGGGTRVITLHFADATTVTLHCVHPTQFAMTLLRTTGSAEHVRDVLQRLGERRFRVVDDEVRDADGMAVPVADEAAVYALTGLPLIAPELREAMGEIAAAAGSGLPTLLDAGDIRGVLHCHSLYSDGGYGIRDLANAAMARGWSYLGISDHSRSALNAHGMSADAVRQQHDEIDAVNATLEGRFRVLKGVEADILPCGTVDFGAPLLDRFEYVIASVHTRFGLNATQMTDRVLKAMEDPHVTIIGHPTGRLLLTREPYAIDLAAILRRAAQLGVAVELNADPHRLDMDWRWCRAARDAGVQVELGPDAHSIAGLDHVALGVSMARKGWLGAGNVLNTRSADDVLAFARRRRAAVLAPA
ncbi:MAG TPA: helix-hairpin-helix domain-containing protein [Gemmatimonadaceae bacterium]|nr:helix-hairpin-helix domain-containing protein [Gemmatimonadaceae bacterium]